MSFTQFLGHLLCNMIYYLHNKLNRINENLHQQTDLNTIWKYNFFNLIFKIIQSKVYTKKKWLQYLKKK